MARVTLAPSGWSFDALAGESVLEAALRSGIALPSSCRNGTCRTCIARSLGSAAVAPVRHRVDWPGLSAEEKSDGWLLPCVALADVDLAIEAPRAARVVPGAAGS